MYQDYSAEDSDASFLERRWFAAGRAASDVESECESLAEVLDAVQIAWREARLRLAQLETLRDALGEQLAAPDARLGEPPMLRESAA